MRAQLDFIAASSRSGVTDAVLGDVIAIPTQRHERHGFVYAGPFKDSRRDKMCSEMRVTVAGGLP